MGLISSLGKRAPRLHCLMMGTRFSSMNLRVLSRTSRSSSLSSVSNSIKSTPLNLSAIRSLFSWKLRAGKNLRGYQAAKSGVKHAALSQVASPFRQHGKRLFFPVVVLIYKLGKLPFG